MKVLNINVLHMVWFGLCCLTPLSTIFQLYSKWMTIYPKSKFYRGRPDSIYGTFYSWIYDYLCSQVSITTKVVSSNPFIARCDFFVVFEGTHTEIVKRVVILGKSYLIFIWCWEVIRDKKRKKMFAKPGTVASHWQTLSHNSRVDLPPELRVLSTGIFLQ
jgi:hypothetical protein